jgi:hypothetical protein
MLKIFVVAVAVFAADDAWAKAAMPVNTIDCTQFKREREGWRPIGFVTFDIGSAKGVTLFNLLIKQGSLKIGGFDVYDALQGKCRRH